MPALNLKKIFCGMHDNKMANIALNDEEYKQGKVVLSSSPKTIFIQAAGPCNSACAFCSRGREYEIFSLAEHKERFEKSLYPYIAKAETLALTGSGEFLLLPEAAQILEFFDKAFPEVEKFFATNGASLVPEICSKFVDGKSRYALHVSLHASNPNLHKVITRMDNFNKIVEHIKYLIKLRRDNNRIRVNLIFVATTLNIDDLPDFVRMAADLHVDRVVCYYNYIYIPTQKYLSCFFKQELANKMFDEAQVLADRLKMQLDLPPRFGQKVYPKAHVCREPFTQIMFNSQGHALPCDASEDCSEALTDGKEFMEVWNSPYYQKLRKSLIEGTSSCFKHCLRANPSSVNNFSSHVIHRGRKPGDTIDILWGDNF